MSADLTADIPAFPCRRQGIASKAIASFEYTAVSADSPFYRRLRGYANAMHARQANGFKLFVGKGNCSVCHSAPNFTGHGRHNLGPASHGKPERDMGRHAQRPVASMKGAFKTPTLRDIDRSAPCFHDGEAMTLMEVIEHYDRGGVVKADLSLNMKPLALTRQEKEDLVAFMQALSSPYKPVARPELPRP